MDGTMRRRSIEEGCVRIRIRGPLAIALGREVEVPLKGDMTIEDVYRWLLEEYGEKASEAGVYPALKDLFSQNLILVNGVEISALEGRDTRIEPGDDVIIINYTHGG